jgi:hypothetical protein
VTVTGENTPENVLGYLTAVRAACVQRGCPAVLIEENLKGPGLSITKIFDVISKASQGARPGVTIMAYVDVNSEHDRTRMKFAEDVAVNLGISVRVFDSLPDAEQWLRDTLAPPQ